MNILQTISGFGANSGGPSTCTYDLVATLNRLNCCTDILTLQSSDLTNRLMGFGEDWIKALPPDEITPFGFSNNLLSYNFLNETISSKSKEYEVNELINERNQDKQLKDNIIVLDHYSQFSKDDKEIIEELFVKLVTARKSMSLKAEHKIGLENYLE